jgi:sugar/nucleoside kinase (ribokinase family)
MELADDRSRYRRYRIGNAIVDVMAPAQDADIARLGLAKGGMTLVDADRARELYDAMGPAREISGGSAANTLAGLAALGATCFIGQVAQDQLGEVSRTTSAPAASPSPRPRAKAAAGGAA